MTLTIKTFKTHEDIFLFLKDYLMKECEIPEQRLFPETNLYEDLSLDSIDAFNLASMIEKEMDIAIADDDLKKIVTIQDIMDYIAHRIHPGTASSAPLEQPQ